MILRRLLSYTDAANSCKIVNATNWCSKDEEGRKTLIREQRYIVYF